jgi:hypothetical protein
MVDNGFKAKLICASVLERITMCELLVMIAAGAGAINFKITKNQR